MDKELTDSIKEGRKFVLESMKKVREEKLDLANASSIYKGAKELVNLGKLELEIAKFSETKK